MVKIHFPPDYPFKPPKVRGCALLEQPAPGMWRPSSGAPTKLLAKLGHPGAELQWQCRAFSLVGLGCSNCVPISPSRMICYCTAYPGRCCWRPS